MKASEYLQKRQDFLAFEARWVNHLPNWTPNPDGLNACAILGGEYYISVDSGAFQYLKSALRGKGHTGGVGEWNDRDERTLVEVLDLFDDAIRLAKEAGD